MKYIKRLKTAQASWYLQIKKKEEMDMHMNNISAYPQNRA